MDRKPIQKAIESIIFASDKPVSLQKLRHIFSELSGEQIQQHLNELIQEWNIIDRSFRLHEVAGGYQFRTAPEFSEFILRFKQLKPFRLSRAALEVLAIVAYRQPITRVEIDHIRGVDSSGVVTMLLDKRLVEIRGRKDVIGRPFLYGTTEEFLETFSLKSLSDLPTLKELEEIEKALEPNLMRLD